MAANDRCRNVITKAHYTFEKNASRIGGFNITAAERAGRVVCSRSDDRSDSMQTSGPSAKEVVLTYESERINIVFIFNYRIFSTDYSIYIPSISNV